MSSPSVSIVMNCYNSSKFVKEAIESVIAQSFKDWELIFWDNQSTDESPEIFHSYSDSRLKYYRAEAHTTLGEARNLAASKSSGKWLSFIDCDDVWFTEKLEKQLASNGDGASGVGMLYGLVKIQINDGHAATDVAKYYSRLNIRPHAAENIFNRLLLGNFIIFSSVMVLRELFIKVGGIDPTLKQNEDYDLLLKIALVSKAVCVDQLCVVYRIHASNNSHAQAELSYKENIRIFSLLPQTDAVKKAISINYSRYAVHLISIGRIFEGIRLLLSKGALIWAVQRFFFRLTGK